MRFCINVFMLFLLLMLLAGVNGNMRTQLGDCFDEWRVNLARVSRDSRLLVPCYFQSIENDPSDVLNQIEMALTCREGPEGTAQNFTSAVRVIGEENVFKLVKMCLEADNSSKYGEKIVSYIVDLDLSGNYGFIQLKRRFPSTKPPKESLFRRLPRINLQLPADFFHPFACSSTSTISVYNLTMLLTIYLFIYSF